jgi:hypothetical protein
MPRVSPAWELMPMIAIPLAIFLLNLVEDRQVLIADGHSTEKDEGDEFCRGNRPARFSCPWGRKHQVENTTSAAESGAVFGDWGGGPVGCGLSPVSSVAMTAPRQRPRRQNGTRPNRKRYPRVMLSPSEARKSHSIDYFPI